MKIALCSDVHLEFGPLELQNTEGADVLLLAGDILVANDLYDFATVGGLSEQDSSVVRKYRNYFNFFRTASKEFKRVLWIAGNHEHYHGNVIHTNAFINKFLMTEAFGNVEYLDGQTVQLDDFTLYGGTLWTDMNHGDPNVMNALAFGMNDYQVVRNGVVPLRPADTIEYHKQHLVNIAKVAKENSKVIIMGHHAPSPQSIHPRYQDPRYAPMNYGYNSDLSELILDNPSIKLWVHGHVHDDFDYMIGSTRIVANPRGYHNYEPRAAHFQLKYIDL